MIQRMSVCTVGSGPCGPPRWGKGFSHRTESILQWTVHGMGVGGDSGRSKRGGNDQLDRGQSALLVQVCRRFACILFLSFCGALFVYAAS